MENLKMTQTEGFPLQNGFEALKYDYVLIHVQGYKMF